MKDRISRSLQENLVTLLCFDDARAKMVRNSVDVDLFEGAFREVAVRAYSYVDRYGKAPGEHIADELDDVLNGKDKRRGEHFKRLLTSMHELRSGINATYVMDQVTTFVRQQTLKSGILQAAEILQSGATDANDEAETILSASLKNRAQLFDPGSRLNDPVKAMAIFDQPLEAFPTGIDILDSRGLGPARKTMHVLIGLAKRGKTWWLTNLGKYAALNRLNVLHITLEMSEPEIVRRYFQAFFAVSKRPEAFAQTRFRLDDKGRLEGLTAHSSKPKLSFEDENIRKAIIKRMKQLDKHLKRIVVKEFPTGQLSMRGLEAYLDNLQDTLNFTPDLLLLDYPELMALGNDDYRLAIGATYKAIRGLAVSRNMAVAVVSQSNRAGLGSKLVTEGNAAEDFSKIATSDVVITFNQTDEERRLGLARLYVAAARRDEDKMTILVAQSYATGQFVLQSTMMSQEYAGELERLSGEEIE